ncbi:MAG: RHS repeat-associated core domain-containing protein, partial [Lentimicrobiaceae bacterium]|nr:RHS repeat-associated core domain-containing protein [Lentimicrobiaceae bacterium]
RLFMRALEKYHIKYATIQPDSPLGITFSTFNFQLSIFNFKERSTWNTPYKFSAKELDDETGYSYFGARYYDPNISIWLSVDPLSDKYPGYSPYNYTLNNPILLIDPNGTFATKYEDGEGNTILETKDGSMDVVVVPKDRLEDFQKFAEQYEQPGMKEIFDGEGWNGTMKADILGFETVDEMEFHLGAASSQFARQKMIEYFEDPTTENWAVFCLAEVVSQNINPLNHIPAPIKIKAKAKLKTPSAKESTTSRWNQFQKEMGRGAYTKEKYGSSEAAMDAKKSAYEQWKIKQGAR